MNKFFILIASLLFLTFFSASCSNDEPDGKGQPLEGGSKMAIVSKLVNGETNGVFSMMDYTRYDKNIGKSKWNRDDQILMGDSSKPFPSYMIFRDSECLVSYFDNIFSSGYGPSRIYGVWYAYCQKNSRNYEIYIRVPYVYVQEDERIVMRGRTFSIEFENSKGFQLGRYYSDAYQDHKRVATYALNNEIYFNESLALIYDTVEEMYADMIVRLKETFAEDGNQISTSTLSHPIDFDKLQEAMDLELSEFPL